MRFLLTVLTTVSLLLTNEGRAQFLGDTFFETPSISAENGEEVTLVVAAFTGAEVFGSTDFVLSFDSTLFDVSSISFPDNLSGLTTSQSEAGITEIRIVAANGTSLESPTGIASFANITGTVLANAGTTIPFTTENRNVFLANRTDITNNSLGAEIIVKSSSVSSALAVASLNAKEPARTVVEARPGSDLYERAIRISPNGTNVMLAQPDGSYSEIVIIKEEN